MRKLFKPLTLLAIGAFAFLQTGCGTENQVSRETKHEVVVPTIAELKAADPIQIKMHSTMGQANMKEVELMTAEFQKTYPNISVLHESKGAYPALEESVSMAISAGDPELLPDLVVGYPDHLATYMGGDRVANIEKYINHSDPEIGLVGDYAKEDIIDSYMKELQDLPKNGSYGLPYSKSTEMFVYNKTVLNEVGFTIPGPTAWTWEDVVAASEKIRNYAVGGVKKYASDDPENGFMPFAIDSADNAFITLGQQWGGTFTKSDGQTIVEHVAFQNDEKFKNGLKFFAENANKGYFNTSSYFNNAQYASAKFVTQNVFMTAGSTAGIRYNIPTSFDPAKGGFEIGVATYPQPKDLTDGRKKQVIQQGPSISMLWRGGDDHESEAGKKEDLRRLASWLFMRFITNTENSAAYAMMSGYNPVRTSSRDSDALKNYLAQTNEKTSSYHIAQAMLRSYDQASYMMFTPAFAGSSKIRTDAGAAFTKIVQDAKNSTEYDTIIKNAIDALMDGLSGDVGV